MRTRLLLTVLLLMALPVRAADQYTYTVEQGEWLYIPVSLPEAKRGGGDFYNLQVELVANDSSTEYTMVTGGIHVRSQRTGIFTVLLHVNHITKTSCAGAEVSQYLDDEIEVRVVE
ncbi:MAG: hypothetical protein WBB19_19140 [Desulforhopalus sp.]